MKTFVNLINEYRGYEFSSGSTTGQDFKLFARRFKSILKHECNENGWELIMGKTQHYYLSGFVRSGDKFVYFSISDVRHFPNEWSSKVLVRTAKHSQDYTGGSNNFTGLLNLTNTIANYFAY